MTLEARIGITPWEELQAQREQLSRQLAPLEAKYGPGGTWDAQRKVNVSTIRGQLRAEAALAGTKMSEAALDETAHADDRYTHFIARTTEERARWAELRYELQTLDFRINREQAVARFAAMERTL